MIASGILILTSLFLQGCAQNVKGSLRKQVNIVEEIVKEDRGFSHNNDDSFGDPLFSSQFTQYALNTKNKTASVYKFLDRNDEKCSIPDKVIVKEKEKGNISYTVTSIGYDTGAKGDLCTSIIIPNTVTSIKHSAFDYMKLKSVIFKPNSQLKSIGQFAF